MPARQKSNIQFIPHFEPDGISSTSNPQRQIRSHAARVAHARVRVSRMREYNKQTAEGRSTSGNLYSYTSPKALTGNEVEIQTELWPSPLNYLSSNRREPFMRAAITLKPVEHFLLDYFVTAVIPIINLDCRWLPRVEQTYQCMIKDWAHLALGNEGLLRGILLSACRRLEKSVQDRKVYHELAVRYKLESVRFVIDAISKDVPDKSDTIVRIITLAFDEMYGGDTLMFERHMDGAIRLVCMIGGPKMLPGDGFLESMYDVALDMRGRVHQGIPHCPQLAYTI
ncbi:hypothetical protein DM02DRAFT_733126 [Periconia macrospinosa]|uniref:Uncharacterized protein n=1 Tax=Periconia macrospinosa TaxID=97972 RepID=A0A2V1D5T9_9PLEO|nr:hypothetical protein DM02DRAFT_733126 [Periconia macrospinosa]